MQVALTTENIRKVHVFPYRKTRGFISSIWVDSPLLFSAYPLQAAIKRHPLPTIRIPTSLHLDHSKWYCYRTMNDFSLTLSESNVSAWSCSVLMKLSISDPIDESSSARSSDVLLHLHERWSRNVVYSRLDAGDRCGLKTCLPVPDKTQCSLQ